MAGESKNWACTTTNTPRRVGGGRKRVKREAEAGRGTLDGYDAHKVVGGVTLTADPERKFSFVLHKACIDGYP